MLVKLGERRGDPDVVDLLLECHDRIRRFTSLARRLAHATDLDAAAVRSAATQIHRYFAEALPMHVADEDELIAPRLAGTSAEVDDALATMAREHVAHEPVIAGTLAICGALASDPQRLSAVAPGLAATADGLAALFAVHLEREERVIFPAIRKLPIGELATIRAAIRARREG